MQPIVIRVEDLVGDLAGIASEEEDSFITFSADPKELAIATRRLWGMVLLMAVRDRATSLHYHPWRGDGSLAYVVDNARYEMVPPPPEFADEIMHVGRAVFVAPAYGLLSRLLHRPRGRTACATVSLGVGGLPILWDVVCWSSGERSGLDFFRVTPLEPLDPKP